MIPESSGGITPLALFSVYHNVVATNKQSGLPVDLWAACRANPAHRVHRRKILSRQNLLTGKFCAGNVRPLRIWPRGQKETRSGARVPAEPTQRRCECCCFKYNAKEDCWQPIGAALPSDRRACPGGVTASWSPRRIARASLAAAFHSRGPGASRSAEESTPRSIVGPQMRSFLFNVRFFFATNYTAPGLKAMQG